MPAARSYSVHQSTKTVTEEELIEGCRAGNRLAQERVYQRYSAKMFGLSRRYVKTTENAEEVLVQAFCKVFRKIDKYAGKGSFEGWIRRIVVNEALMFLRKKYRFSEHVEITEVPAKAVQISVEDELSAREILALLEQLPTGYRTVFNLYVVEGYKHREIAEMLGISINTSKSQLILAKKKMRTLVEAARQIRGTE
ncbi:RNA polymerase sigma factor [Saprospira grandis]|uniref:RNA polymerase, sigma-24 subunit, ecf subfamily protein n=1 Tax=Saprospira grandis (strain Lewin) TaxID=984262 RepID=H6L1C6_SAPGL|nr:sigma-70 family RNA polymerase sigma factor [Saprospira grandis]AFC23467.1 RNA polymerase, sigma-24 subunit, ecf subfamily protein [Saprospira grandis str. Lewin]